MPEHDAEDPDTTPAKPVDLRFTSAEQSGVRINRDLSGQGHLARGSGTHMSNMKFSVRAQPRQELDPELQALRPSEPPAPIAAPVARLLPDAVPEPVAPPAPVSPPSGILGAIKKLFS